MTDSTFFKNNGPFTVKQIAEILKLEVPASYDDKILISNVQTMQKAGRDDICFFYDKKAKDKAKNISARVCVTTKDLAEFVPQTTMVLISDAPKRAFLTLIKAFYEEYRPAPSISQKASIASSAKIGQNVYIGDFAVIEENVIIGDECRIESHAHIGRNCKIGDRCRIGAGAYVSYCLMGTDCYIYSGVRIGCDGFGFETIDGKHVRIPQLGRVIIGNDVEVGANTCIDRGALDDTVIGDGCRIDNLVQIAHNDKLGRGCIVVAQTGVAGSCTFGDYVVCGGQTGFADHLNIGSGAQIAAQSGVMRDVEPGSVLLGTPAVPFKDFMRQVAFLQKNSKK